MKARWVAGGLVAAGVAATVAFVGGRGGAWWPHLASHAASAVLGGFAFVAIVAHRRRWGERWAWRSVALAAVATGVFFVAQVVEMLSAVVEYPDAGPLHASTGLASMLALAAGVGGAFGRAALSLPPGWPRRVVGTALAASAALLFFGLAFGFARGG